MAGDALAAMEALDGVGGDAHVHLFFDERMGHGVVMAMDLDVIVDVDPGLLPLGVFVRFDGQGRRAGLSSCSNRARRVPGSFLKGRLLSVSSNARTARFNSAREKH